MSRPVSGTVSTASMRMNFAAPGLAPVLPGSGLRNFGPGTVLDVIATPCCGALEHQPRQVEPRFAGKPRTGFDRSRPRSTNGGGLRKRNRAQGEALERRLGQGFVGRFPITREPIR